MPARKASALTLVPERAERRIYLIRSQRVILSSDLAELYGVPVRTLNQAVSRNRERFPDDFMFQLTKAETEALSRSQSVILNETRAASRSQSVILNNAAYLKAQTATSRRGANIKYRPYAFTEQGVAMLSAVLRSPTAVRVSIEIVRAFVRLRQLLATHEDLRVKLEALEHKLSEHDEKFAVVFDAIRELMQPPADASPEHPFGFHPKRLPQAKKR